MDITAWLALQVYDDASGGLAKSTSWPVDQICERRRKIISPPFRWLTSLVIGELLANEGKH